MIPIPEIQRTFPFIAVSLHPEVVCIIMTLQMLIGSSEAPFTASGPPSGYDTVALKNHSALPSGLLIFGAVFSGH